MLRLRSRFACLVAVHFTPRLVLMLGLPRTVYTLMLPGWSDSGRHVGSALTLTKAGIRMHARVCYTGVIHAWQSRPTIPHWCTPALIKGVE